MSVGSVCVRELLFGLVAGFSFSSSSSFDRRGGSLVPPFLALIPLSFAASVVSFCDLAFVATVWHAVRVALSSPSLLNARSGPPRSSLSDDRPSPLPRTAHQSTFPTSNLVSKRSGATPIRQLGMCSRRHTRPRRNAPNHEDQRL